MKVAVDSIPYIHVLGVRVHMVQIPDVVGLIARWIEDSRPKCRQIVITGMHGIMEAQRDSGFKTAVNSVDLFFPDGISVVWVARRRGFNLKKEGTGPELLREFCRVANGRGYRNFFYGDTEETLQLLAANLTREFPALQVAGTYSPPFGPLTTDEDNSIIRMINDTTPDVLWVGLGCPKQERWISEHKEKLNVRVAIGVGASFKFYSGRVKRAPAWLRNLGFEWLWRLLSEPRRIWRRVFIDGTHFIWNVSLELTGLKKYE